MTALFVISLVSSAVLIYFAFDVENYLDNHHANIPKTIRARIAAMNPFLYTAREHVSFGFFGNVRGCTPGNLAKMAVAAASITMHICRLVWPIRMAVVSWTLIVFAITTWLMYYAHPAIFESRYDPAFTLVKPIGVAVLGKDRVNAMIRRVSRWHVAAE
jgi:hypothetical protein